MKSILNIVFTTFFIMMFQFCSAQKVEYFNFYNKLTPKLQTIANDKTQFYNQNFEGLYKRLNEEKVTIKMFAYDTKIFNSKDNYILKIYFADNETRSYTIDNNYQFPIITIMFKNKIPDEIVQLTKQYHGEWNNYMFDFFSHQIIEKIDFYGINGISSTNRKAR